MPIITVFTPTYNRIDLLERCYKSVCNQTYKDFIWMIIDDGSTDNTEAVVRKWQSECQIPQIEYIHKENGGLHTAYNEAIAHIQTELCMCIDSDDFMPKDAIEKVLQFWKEHGSNEYAGIVGLDFDLEGHVIGDPLPNQKTVNLIDLLIGKYPIVNGDRTNVVRTELYRQVAPMKVFPGEKNFNPHYMHLLISKKYDFLVLNENLRFVEYQPAGMSNSILKQYKNSPNSFIETRKLYLSFQEASIKFKFRNCVHLVSSCLLANRRKEIWSLSPYKGLTIWAYLPGVFLSRYIIRKAK